MADRVEFGLPVQALQGAPESGDRFVYSFRFATLSNIGSNGRPVLTVPQWKFISRIADLNADAWQEWHSANGGQVKNFIEGTKYSAAGGGHTGTPEGLRIADVPDDATMRFETPGGQGGQSGGGSIYTGQNFKPPTAAAHMTPTSPFGPGSEAFDPLVRQPTRDVLVELAESQIGVLFLDRTRLRPSGFVVGEHLHTLGLAAGEEAVLEQRSFIQREITDENSNETEESGEGETTSTYSKDDSEVITGTETTTRTDGFNAGGNVGFQFGVDVQAGGGVNETTVDADNDTRTDSVKEIFANTTKNIAKRRSLHKTVFKISATDRFERSAKRTIRNPNAHTPIDLHFYKVLQRIRISQERYGIRLCWTPFVADPSSAFFQVEADTKTAMLERARKSVPEPSDPGEPKFDGVPQSRIVGLDPPFTELTAWNKSSVIGTDMSADYTLPINVPSGMKWDGDSVFVHQSLRHDLTGHPRDYSVDVVGDPWEVVNSSGDRTIFQKVHCGAPWNAYSSQIYVGLSAMVIPDTTSIEQEKAKIIAAYQAKLKSDKADYKARLAEVEAVALAEFEVWRAAHRASLNPKQELMRRFITTMFNLPEDRDSVAELDVWEQVFDWSLMSARLYSGSWSGNGHLREPHLSPTDFVNASWARLYLPVRPGFEETALRWMHLRDKVKTGPQSIEDFIAKILKDIKDWRVNNLGGAAEVTVTPVQGQPCPAVVQKYVCLGTWLDDMPTDGVHTEVTLAKTTAADPLTEAIANAQKQRVIYGGKVSEALADAQLNDVEVHVHLGENAP